MISNVEYAVNAIYRNGRSGINIIVEGPVRCGKTTLINEIKDALIKAHPEFKVKHIVIDGPFVCENVLNNEAVFYERIHAEEFKEYNDIYGHVPYIKVRFSAKEQTICQSDVLRTDFESTILIRTVNRCPSSIRD